MPAINEKSVMVECQTMGHANCRKVLRREPKGWKLHHIIHHVFGTRRIENIHNH